MHENTQAPRHATETRPRVDPVLVDAAMPRSQASPSLATGVDLVDVAVVGMGYVGLPTALAFVAAGCSVTGVDVDERRLDMIRRGAVDLIPEDHARLASLQTNGARERWRLTTNLDALGDATCVVICVPTPVDRHKVPDLSALTAACEAVVEHARPGQVIVCASTAHVGATTSLLVEPLKERGLRVGRDLHVAFSPERIDPGNTTFTQHRTPRVVGGATAECAMAASEFLGHITPKLHVVSSCEAAEMTKLYENTFRAVNIALANEMASVADAYGLDVVEVIDSAATKPYGFMPFYPGPGVGGHCIPCDPHYLLWGLRASGGHAPLVGAAMDAIVARPRRIAEQACAAVSLPDRGIHGARILVVGVTYKPDVADVRESPALEIMGELRRRGAEVRYVDPYVPELRLPDGARLASDQAPDASVWDLVVLHTPHRCMPTGWLANLPVVLDATYRLDGHEHPLRP